MVTGMELFANKDGELFIVKRTGTSYRVFVVEPKFARQFNRKHEAVRGIATGDVKHEPYRRD